MGVTQIIIFVAIIGVMWFVLIRPQQQRQKEHTQLVSALKQGVRVVTIGGLVGEIVDVGEETVVISTGDGVEVEYIRDAVARVLKEGELTADYETVEVEEGEAEHAEESDSAEDSDEGAAEAPKAE